MRIIIEGCDGTGKTTLARMLASRTNSDYIHCERDDPKDLEYYYQTMRKTNFVYDRHFVGEMVYPEIFSRKSQLNKEQFELLLWNARMNDVKIIVLYSTEQNILSKNENDQYSEVVENSLKINENFLQLAKKYDLPIFDVLTNGYKEVMDFIYAIY